MTEPVERDKDVADSSAVDPATQVEVTNLETEEEKRQKVRVEEFAITGDTLVSKVKEFIHQGNIRRIIIKNDEGRILIEVPLTVGVVGGALATALFPVVAAIGAIGALVAHLTVVIERIEE